MAGQDAGRGLTPGQGQRSGKQPRGTGWGGGESPAKGSGGGSRARPKVGRGAQVDGARGVGGLARTDTTPPAPVEEARLAVRAVPSPGGCGVSGPAVGGSCWKVRPEWPRGKAGQGPAQMVPVEEAVGTAAGRFPGPRPYYHSDTAGCPACGLHGDLPHRRLPRPALRHMSPCSLPPPPQAGGHGC